MLEAALNGTTQRFLGLIQGADSSLAVTFNASTGQMRAAGSGEHGGLCITGRDDVHAVLLAECEASGVPRRKATQSWLWFAGQLKAAGADGKCIGLAALPATSGAGAGGEVNQEAAPRLLTLVPCTDGAEEAALVWGFNGQLPGATAHSANSAA